MKKISRRNFMKGGMTVAALTVLSQIGIPAFADSAVDEGSIISDGFSPVTADGIRAIEYLPNESVWFLKNIPASEVISIFETEWTSAAPPVRTVVNDTSSLRSMFPESSSNLLNAIAQSNTMRATAATWVEPFYLETAMTGMFGESVPIRFPVRMNMTTQTINGVEYSQFVSFAEKQNATFGGGVSRYEFALDTTAAWELNDDCDTLTVTQLIQLITTTEYNVGLEVSGNWGGIDISGSGGLSGTCFYRSDAEYLTARHYLPIHYLPY